jgi:hypothetical protein
MRVRRVLLGLTLVAGVAGCVRKGAVAPQNGGHYVITQEELDRATELSLYDAVLKLRPHFLKNRSVTAHGRDPSRQLMLYVNGERMDGVDDLRRFSPTEVQEVRFYEPHLANTYFARYNNAGGAIAIKLRKLDGMN